MQKFKEFILAIPFVYTLLQWLFASPDATQKLLANIKAKPGDVILDIGSGTSSILEHLPEVEYHGFDMNEEYLDVARKKYVHRNAHFYCSYVSSMTMPEAIRGRCDIVLAIGILHHMDDNEVIKFFEMVEKALKPGGYLLSIDPVFIDNQGALAKFLVGSDRGRFVRHKNHYERLYTTYFNGTFAASLDSIIRFPYNQIFYTANKKS